MTPKSNLLTFLAGFAICLASCAKNDSTVTLEGPASPYTVAATVGMIADIVSLVAGDNAEVSGIIGEGVDPHLYKPTSTDVKTMQSANMVFYNGLMLEGKMGDILVRLARSGKPVYAVTEEILNDSDYILTDEEDHQDPHVWMDVQGWIKAVNVVAAALSEYDAANASEYRENASTYIAELEALDAYAKEKIASIPESQRVLVTAHDAFGYMAQAYGLKVLGIQGLSTESEAGVKDIESLVSYLVENNIPAVFVETSVSDKNIKALIEGAGAKGHDVVIGGELFSDAMGEAGTYEGTYFGMIDHNVTTITRALGGDAPEGGISGKLSDHFE